MTPEDPFARFGIDASLAARVLTTALMRGGECVATRRAEACFLSHPACFTKER